MGFFSPSTWEKFFLNIWYHWQYKEGSLLLPSIKNPRHSVLLTGDFPFHLPLSGNTFPVNGRFAFTAKPYKLVHGTKFLSLQIGRTSPV